MGISLSHIVGEEQMASYVFPIPFEEFAANMEGEHVEMFDKLGDKEDSLEFAYGCLRQGWLNKQYHKEKQGKDQEFLRSLKEKMKRDPELRARILQDERLKKIV